MDEAGGVDETSELLKMKYEQQTFLVTLITFCFSHHLFARKTEIRHILFSNNSFATLPSKGRFKAIYRI